MWNITNDVEEFAAAVGSYLRLRPAENTVSLTTLEILRAGRMHSFGEGAPLFGWWTGDDGRINGTFLHTPPFPLLLNDMPDEAVQPLVDTLDATGRILPGLHGSKALAEKFGAAWHERTSAAVAVHRRDRLYRLHHLVLPEPFPAGHAVPATAEHRSLLRLWYKDFERAVGEPSGSSGRRIDDRLSYPGGLSLWIDEHGEPVSMSGLTRQVAGMLRVTHVFTPAAHRGKGYGSAIVATVTQAALDADADEVLLFADFESPDSLSMFEQLGYFAMDDRLKLTFHA